MICFCNQVTSFRGLGWGVIIANKARKTQLSDLSILLSKPRRCCRTAPKMWTQWVVVWVVLAASSHGNDQFGDSVAVARPVQNQTLGAPWPKPRSMAVTSDYFALSGPSTFR